MKFSTSLISSGVILSSSAQALNVFDVPQQVIGWVDHAIASGFGRTPATAHLKEIATDAGIDAMWLPDSIRQYWHSIESMIPTPESLAEKKSRFWPRVSSHLLTSPQKSKSSQRPIKKRTDWDMYVSNKEAFPMHSLRVKKTPESLGLDKVKQYTGYFDVNKEGEDGKHLFYWFFESRNDPKNDPIVVWLNGGPGCSSLMGLFYELGPSSILTPTETPIFNPYAWNNNASVIFLDQPAGVGFSYTDSGKVEVSDTRTAATDVYAFLSLFFQQFPEYKDLGLHISGESYAGHYIPAIATEILSHPERDFLFSSILIGNGWTDTYHQVAGYGPMACGEGGYKAVLSEEQCAKVNRTSTRCQWLDGLCYKHQDRFRCIPATYSCDSVLDPYIDTGLNPYDIRKPCVGNQDMCYDDIDYYSNYLNREDIQAIIGAEVSVYEGCSDPVFNAFTYTGDGGKPFQFDVAKALEKGLPVLIYAGDKDYICNWVGQVLWLNSLEWSGSEVWSSGKFETWETVEDQEAAGQYKVAGNLTFVRVFDAGHMVPYDQPKHALDMVTRWLHGGKSFA